MDEDLLVQMKSALLYTIMETITELGFIPDDLGPEVKQILKEANEIALIALGCYLEDCQKEGNYNRLYVGINDIKTRRTRSQCLNNSERTKD